MNLEKLEADCRAVLKANDRGQHTVPATELYPHQWLWDSCFISIGLRHYNVRRAQKEILSLLKGQWSNGMVPNIIFAKGSRYELDRRMWFSRISPFAPDKMATSGITQPPMLAEAIVRVGEKLSLPERRLWYKKVFPQLLSYHQWLFEDRDPHGEGLVLQVHPYETGLDNTPPWIVQLREHNRPWWLTLIIKLRLENLINVFRRDTRKVPAAQRSSNVESLLYWDVIRRLKRKHYEIDKVLHRSLFSIEDLTFNSIFIRANDHLMDIAECIGIELPEELVSRIHKSRQALEALWHEPTQNYFSRDFITHNLITEPSIASFMPLYSGAISQKRADALVKQLTNFETYWLHHPVPSVPLTSAYFNPIFFWQGPSWINTNWLIIDGLRRYGHDAIADELAARSVEVVEQSGTYEYFSPLGGEGLGSPNFSWTAALIIDILHS